jgi:hypothetical protein
VEKPKAHITCERAMQRGVTMLPTSYCSTSFARVGICVGIKSSTTKVCKIWAAQDAEIREPPSEAEKAYIAQIDPSSQV